MKTYEITVNNKVYQVSVEEIDEVTAKKNKDNKIIQTSQRSQKESKEIDIKAPMPGTIINVMVQLGETVKAGQVLCILEAMKMENEIVAPEDGIVSEIIISKGVAVEAGASLVRL